MYPIDFPESSGSHGDTQPQFLTLPSYDDGTEFISLLTLPSYDDGTEVISRWQLTWWERIKILFVGRLWLRQLTYGNSLQPQLPQIERPFDDPCQH